MALVLPLTFLFFITAGIVEQKPEAIMCIPFCLIKCLYILH